MALTFVASGTGVVRATPEGERWRTERVFDGRARALAHDRRRLFLGSDDGVYTSADGGGTWARVGLETTVTALAVGADGALYAGTRPARLYRSRDGGVRWRELAAFRGVTRALWTWFSPAESPFRSYVQAIAPSPTEPGTLVVGVEVGSVVRTTDGGVTFSGHCAGAIRDPHSIAFNPTDGAWVYLGGAGRGAGGAVSDDAGETWTKPTGMDRRYGWACAGDPTEPSRWYVSASTGPMAAHGKRNANARVFRIEDGRAEAVLGRKRPIRSMPYHLWTTPSAPESVYAGLADGTVWHSPDRGDSWRRLPFSLGHPMRSLLVVETGGREDEIEIDEQRNHST